MKIAFISDIHGNQRALESIVLSDEFDECELCIFCGDMYGYFYSGTQVLKILKDNCDYLIRGNHDDYILKLSKNEFDSNFFDKYGYAHNIALKNLSSDDLSFIRRLPINLELPVDGLRINISHGMPHDNKVYFYEDFQDWQMRTLLSSECDIFVMGHTHHQLHLKKNGKMIINPGSVGQPRSGRKGAQWCMFDTQSLQVDFITQSYDVSPVFNDLSKYGGNVALYLKQKWDSLE